MEHNLFDFIDNICRLEWLASIKPNLKSFKKGRKFVVYFEYRHHAIQFYKTSKRWLNHGEKVTGPIKIDFSDTYELVYEV